MSRSKMRPRRGVALAATAGLVFSPIVAACSGDNESAPPTVPASETSEAPPAPPTTEFDRLTRRAAQTLTCMMASKKTTLVPNSDGGLISIIGAPEAILQAHKRVFPQEPVGIWRGQWSESFTPSTGRASAVDVEGFIPAESAYWNAPQLTLGAIQAGAGDMKGTSLSVVIDPYEKGNPDIAEIAYINTSPAERDPKTLSTPGPDGSWHPATNEDVRELGEKLETALGTLMTKSQITECSARP